MIAGIFEKERISAILFYGKGIHMTLTRFQLKIFAICSMFLDHAMKIFEDVLVPAMGQTLYTAVLSLGRMAFLILPSSWQKASGIPET